MGQKGKGRKGGVSADDLTSLVLLVPPTLWNKLGTSGLYRDTAEA